MKREGRFKIEQNLVLFLFLLLFSFFFFSSLGEANSSFDEENVGVDGREEEGGKGEIDICIGCDSSYKEAILALLKSISVSTERASSVRIWSFAEGKDAEKMNSLFELYAYSDIFPQSQLRVIRYERREELDRLLGVAKNPELVHTTSRKNALGTKQGNFIRFFMPKIFEEQLPPQQRPKQFLYLDCDTLVLEDPRNLVNLIASQMGIDKQICLAASNKSSSRNTRWGTTKILKTMGIPIDLFQGLNAGVLYFDSECWMQSGALERVLYWIKQNQQQRIFYRGKGSSQTPLYYSFYPSTLPLHPRSGAEKYPKPWPYLVFPSKWNRNTSNMTKIQSAGILHFAGEKKPWNEHGTPGQKAIFSQYSIPQKTSPSSLSSLFKTIFGSSK